MSSAQQIATWIGSKPCPGSLMCLERVPLSGGLCPHHELEVSKAGQVAASELEMWLAWLDQRNEGSDE